MTVASSPKGACSWLPFSYRSQVGGRSVTVRHRSCCVLVAVWATAAALSSDHSVAEKDVIISN